MLKCHTVLKWRRAKVSLRAKVSPVLKCRCAILTPTQNLQSKLCHCVFPLLILQTLASSFWSFSKILLAQRKFIYTRTDGKLFNLFCLKEETKVRNLYVRTLPQYQHTIHHIFIVWCFTSACTDFRITISLKKQTNVPAKEPHRLLSLSTKSSKQVYILRNRY